MLSTSRLYSVAVTALFFATLIAAMPTAQSSDPAGDLGDLGGLGAVLEGLVGDIGL